MHQTTTPIPESELIINTDGSIFHLHLKPEDIADTIILVGDPGRVSAVSKFFSSITHQVQNREFNAHTGLFNNKKITVLSTGIGTDNIDIVLNELDALVNIDFKTRLPKTETQSLKLIRIGTSGALQAHIPVDSCVISQYGLGLDGLLHFYRHQFHEEEPLLQEFIRQAAWESPLNTPYLVKGSASLHKILGHDMYSGITATACGFYGPQGRVLRLNTALEDLNQKLTHFESGGNRITNFEMETSALFGLSKLLGHEAITVCAIIANRIRKEFSKDYKLTVDNLVQTILHRITS